jgi:hypothetical protein
LENSIQPGKGEAMAKKAKKQSKFFQYKDEIAALAGAIKDRKKEINHQDTVIQADNRDIENRIRWMINESKLWHKFDWYFDVFSYDPYELVAHVDTKAQRRILRQIWGLATTVGSSLYWCDLDQGISIHPYPDVIGPGYVSKDFVTLKMSFSIQSDMEGFLDKHKIHFGVMDPSRKSLKPAKEQYASAVIHATYAKLGITMIERAIKNEEEKRRGENFHK